MKTQHLIIDGYNIINADSSLKKWAKQNLEQARNELIRLLMIIYENESIDISIIFDGKGEQASRQILRNKPFFQVIFSASEWSADSIIEQISANTRFKQNIIAATQDRMIQHTLHSLNAQTINAQTLISWIKRIETYSQEQYKRKKKTKDQTWSQALKKIWDNL